MSVSPEDPETYLSIFISDKTVMATSNRVLHILENLRVLSYNVQMSANSQRGESPPPWPEKQQVRGCDTVSVWHVLAHPDFHAPGSSAHPVG